VFGGNDAYRETLIVDADEFISVKSYKAKGKRLTTFEVETINELEPIHFKAPAPTPSGDEGSGEDDNNDGSESNEEPEDTELNGTTGVEEEYEDIVDPEIPEKPTEPEPSTPEAKESKPVKPRKGKPVKPAPADTAKKDEIIDNGKIIDDITGQLTLFD